MKKISKEIALIMFVLFGFIISAKAEDEYCSVEDKVRLNNMASVVEINYDMVLVDNYYGVDIKVRNLNPDLYIIAKSKKSEPIIMDSKSFNSKNEIVIRKMDLEKIDTIKFSIYSYSNCTYQVLRTIPVTIPKFNYHSQMDMCLDVPEFYLCQPLVTYDIKDVDFAKEIDGYKKRLSEQENKKALEKKSDENGGIAGVISKNKYIIVIVVLAVGIAATVIVLKKRGSVLK